MPDGELLPGVENRITIGMMLPHYAQLSQEEAAAAEKLSLQFMASETPQSRSKAPKAVMSWSPLCDKEMLQTLAENGVDSRQERITLRNYLVFERSLLKQYME